MTPDQVKAYFRANAVTLTGSNALAQGAGEINLAAMLTAAPPSKYTQKFHAGSGTGSLEAARGQDHLTRDGVVLSGEQDIFGQPFNSARWRSSRPRAAAGPAASGTAAAGPAAGRGQLVGQQLDRQQLVG